MAVATLMATLSVQAQTKADSIYLPPFMLPDATYYLPAPPDSASYAFLDDIAQWQWAKTVDEERAARASRESLGIPESSVNNEYLRRGKLYVETLGRGFAWLDTGNHDALLDASDFVAAFQKRQGLYISCIEEIAFKRGFITKEQLLALAEPLMKTAYGQYLVEVANGL